MNAISRIIDIILLFAVWMIGAFFLFLAIAFLQFSDPYGIAACIATTSLTVIGMYAYTKYSELRNP